MRLWGHFLSFGFVSRFQPPNFLKPDTKTRPLIIATHLHSRLKNKNKNTNNYVIDDIKRY